jgi:hypothetical protein
MRIVYRQIKPFRTRSLSISNHPNGHFPILMVSQFWEKLYYEVVSLITGEQSSVTLKDMSSHSVSPDGRYVCFSGSHSKRLVVIDLIDSQVVGELDCAGSEYERLQVVAHGEKKVVFKLCNASVGPTFVLDYSVDQHEQQLLLPAMTITATRGRLTVLIQCGNHTRCHTLSLAEDGKEQVLCVADHRSQTVKVVSLSDVLLGFQSAQGNVEEIVFHEKHGFVILINDEDEPENGLFTLNTEGKLLLSLNAPGGSNLAVSDDGSLLAFTTFSGEDEKLVAAVWDPFAGCEVALYSLRVQLDSSNLAKSVKGITWDGSSLCLIDENCGIWRLTFNRHGDQWVVPPITAFTRVLSLDEYCFRVWCFHGVFVVIETLSNELVVIDIANTHEARQPKGSIEQALHKVSLDLGSFEI